MAAKIGYAVLAIVILVLAGFVLTQKEPAVPPINEPDDTGNAIPSATREVKAYFTNDKLDPEVTCTKVFPVVREVEDTPAVGRAALTELLKGPTAEEKKAGYATSINTGVSIKSILIEEGIARVDFDANLEKGVGGSCRVAAIRSQITQTLLQFPTVRSVVIAVDGRVEDALQP